MLSITEITLADIEISIKYSVIKGQHLFGKRLVRLTSTVTVYQLVNPFLSFFFPNSILLSPQQLQLQMRSKCYLPLDYLQESRWQISGTVAAESLPIVVS